MASEIAAKIAQLVGLDGDEDVPDVIDNELREVREIVDECEAAMRAAKAYASNDLQIVLRVRGQRARSLLARLTISDGDPR